ncbi:zinc-dependent metalloprotease [Galactobacter valiniphilus]|uniref:Zinc-dependent metalloprotease n=1 Tax=Galactobacter valiniphilus TaxID=2676122 RepID=A0A399JAH9_9MICC|nr:zinc-dependent metalloprotease [Galactobacter valiniphilus]RII42585.1 zinc-dependent metalloprotease [Galactobacter valiniphilus]
MAENDHRPDPDDDQPQDPLSRMFGQFMNQGGGGMPDASSMQAMFSQLQSFFGAMAAGGTGPVNWTLAKETAQRAVAEESTVTQAQASDVFESAQLAQLWLDAATDFPDANGQPRALRRSQWVEASLPQWQSLAEPVAASAAEAVSGSLASQIPPELAGFMGQAGGMLSSLGGTLFGAQLGGAVGSLASEVLSGTDAGLPLAGKTFALVSQNVDAFIDQLDLPRQEVVLYLALRESAHLRLFHGAPWLQEHVLGLVKDFASGINIDTSAIQERLQGVDPTDPAALQELMSGGLVAPSTTPRQRAALDRLETTLALIEGWVDAVVTAASTNLPSAPALREMLRRRRATGGPAEQAFAGLVGLELRPRRAREAAALWEKIAAERGASERDALWAELGLVPTAEDLDDPDGFFDRRALIGASDDEFDAALSAWLDGTPEGEKPEGEGPDEPTPGDGDTPRA